MAGLRNRLVTEQAGTTWVSPSLLATDEIGEALELEARIHCMAGWDVRRYGATLRFQKGETVRWVWVRSRKPLDDTL